MSRTAERVARNASWSLASGVVAFAAGAVSSVVLARLLGPRDLGTYALVLSMGGAVSLLVTLALPQAVMKYVAEFEARNDRETVRRMLGAVARYQVAASVVAGAAAALAAPALERVFGAPGFASALRLAMLGLVPATLAALVIAALQGLQDYRRAALISLSSTSLYFVTTVALLAAGAGVMGAVGAGVATSVLTAILAVRGIRLHLGSVALRGAVPQIASRKLRRYVPSLTAVLVLDAVVWQRSEIFFLGIYRGAREVGWYALAFGAATILMRLVPRALSHVLPPVASGYYGADDLEGMKTLFRLGGRYLTILTAPLVAGGVLLAGPMLTLVYGKEYRPAAAAFSILLVGAGLGAVGSVAAGIQTGMERQGQVLRIALGATAANLALDVLLIPSGGILGAATASTLAQAGAVVPGILLTRRMVGTGFPVGDCARAVAAAALSAAVGYAVSIGWPGPAGLLAAVGAGALVYLPGLLLFRALRTEDFDRFRSLVGILPSPVQRGYGGLLRLAERWAP